MITKDTIRKIIDTVQILEVVGDFVNLKRSGSIFKGNCPFHQEKTPSFVVNPNKNIFKCFGCGKGGDAVNFIMEHEKMSYPEALKYLANKYNIEVEETYTQTEESKAVQAHADSLYIVLGFAAKYYNEQLLNTEQGKAIALSYCLERGLSHDVIEKFQIGYAPDSYDAFLNTATENSYNIEILLNAGLIRDKNNKKYDFFRDRLMFPIHNVSGKVVAFGGRILKKAENQPKYINTAETEVYHKSQTLYGIFHAKEFIRKQDECILVEGYTDVIALHQAGIKNAVASSGTALTREQVQLIKRFTQNIIILYDGDAAGVNAAMRGLDIVLEIGLNVKIVVLPEAEDPDSFVRNHGTATAMEYIQNNQNDFILFKASRGIDEVSNDPIRKTEIIRDIVKSIALVQDNIKRQLYVKECARIVDIDEQTLNIEINKIKTQQLKKQDEWNNEDVDTIASTQLIEKEKQATKSKAPTFYYQEQDIIRVLLEHADKEMTEDENVGVFVLSELVDVPFKNSIFDKIIKYYINAYEQDVPFKQINTLTHIEDTEIKNALIDIQSTNYELSPNWLNRHEIIVKEANRTYKTDVYSVLNRYKYFKLMEAIQQIDEKIKSADVATEEELIFASLMKKMQFIEIRNQLAKKLGTVIHPY